MYLLPQMMTPLPVHPMRMGDNFYAASVRAAPGQIDPFLGADLFHMRAPTFGPHPHAGFSAITYLLQDSETGFLNRDSLGDKAYIAPGALHWTLAGRGVQHDEVPEHRGRWAHGLQLFIKLPAAEELQPPRAMHLEPSDMPRWDLEGGGSAKLVFGSYCGRRAPVDVPQPVALLDIQLEPGARTRLLLPEGQTPVLLGISGEIDLGNRVVGPNEAITGGRGGRPLLLATSGAAQCLLLLGTPTNEPVHRQGPFALSTVERLEQAVKDFHSGAMGHLEP